MVADDKVEEAREELPEKLARVILDHLNDHPVELVAGLLDTHMAILDLCLEAVEQEHGRIHGHGQGCLGWSL